MVRTNALVCTGGLTKSHLSDHNVEHYQKDERYHQTLSFHWHIVITFPVIKTSTWLFKYNIHEQYIAQYMVFSHKADNK